MDSIGHKHVLGIREGSSENARVVSDLLNDLVDQGIKADRLRLFIIDGNKALRYAIDSVFGHKNPVQHWRDNSMVVRLVAASLLEIEDRFRRIMGYQHLWILETKLNELSHESGIAKHEQVA